ncbi:actin binding Rho activating protein b [Neosynchiropus ocellatus]
MSANQATGQDTHRKVESNRNIKKLRTASVVCSLAGRWQKWVTDNKTRQDTEPSGWAPAWLVGESGQEQKKTWAPKKSPLTGTQVAQQKCETSTDTFIDKGVGPEPPVAVSIKTVQVVKTVSSAAKEKSAGIEMLSDKIMREVLPPVEEIDKLLAKKCSPTRRRKCSNMVSSLTKSWKQVEREKAPVKAAFPGQDQRGVAAEGPKIEENMNTSAVSLKDKSDMNTAEEDSESAVQIKRPSVPSYKKEAEDVSRINMISKKYSAVGNLKSRWQNWASEHTETQKLNPFSEYFDYDYSMSLRLQKGQDGYGRPKEGSKTAERAKRAEQHIHREIADMCYVIRTMADPEPDGKTRVTFGELFDRYVRISDKVVGILMRARKHGKVAFEGEMLWQGRDDDVIITLLV